MVDSLATIGYRSKGQADGSTPVSFSTALKISGVCLLALGAEAILAYYMFSNYAFSLAESGQYSMAEAYTSGPMSNLARLFYILFGLTITVAMGSLLVALMTWLVHRPPRD